MKKVTRFLIAVIAMIMIGSSAFSQGDYYRFTVKTNPLSALGGPFWVIVVPVTSEYKALFETVTTERQSLQVGVSYLGPSVLLNIDEITEGDESLEGVKTAGYMGQFMYKFFLSRDLSAPSGFYLAPHFSYASAKIKDKADPSSFLKGTKTQFNATIGYQMITTGGFCLDIFTGLGFLNKTWTGSDSGEALFDLGGDASRINVPFGLSFGFAF